ncbi:peptidoglycan-binding protein [uncultured Tateyamaria sp.]|uniref:peptidoglycan-binding domain-containing protein n=1 Tax=uncultured Tateyamaria sp. TaxID=455651 RepID=UPI00345CA30E
MPVGSESTEKALGLDKQAIRDVQARLLVIGYDPNGVDGVVGKGTRSAIRSWQAAVSAAATGYLNEFQLIALKEQSQDALDEWLRSDDNANLYKPPPPPPVLALGPRNMSGNWRYTTNCGSGSRLGRMKITGTLAMRHAGGRNYTGTLSNSQGLRGRVNATLRGRSVSAVTNFGLLIGKVSLKARVDDYKLVLRGRDSNGCSFYASK